MPFKYGVTLHPWSATERDFQVAQTLGVGYIKIDFRWPDIQKTRNAPYDFTSTGVWSPKSSYDTLIARSKQYGVGIMPVFLAFPSWISSGETIVPVGAAFDDAVLQFGKFIYAVVDHYKEAITYLEIWNEPDTPNFWKDPDATKNNFGLNSGLAVIKYVRLLNEAYRQAKLANPSCQIVSGGIGIDPAYLREMYAAGADFDVVAVHPYFLHSPTKNYDVDYVNPNPNWPYCFGKIQELRDIMVANGDSYKTIFITEIGIDDQLCPIHSVPVPAVTSPEGHTTPDMQADRLIAVFNKTFREFPWVEGILWYQLKDTHKAFGSVPVTPSNFGLLRMNGTWDPDYPNVIDYTPKPIYWAYRGVITGIPPPVQAFPCPFCELEFAVEADLAAHIRAAHPEQPSQFILDVWVALGGTTTPTGIESVLSGTIIKVTATAAEGYKFGGWQVQIGTEPVITYPATVNPLSLTITAATVVMSLFSLVPVPPICPAGTHWDSTANACVQDTPTKTLAARSIGPLGVPSAVVHLLWRLRERFIRPEVHRKLHPLV